MTLKEKFEEFTEQKSYERTNYDAQECEKIADDYAIQFANWLFNIDKEVLSKQLKEFKKEKGL
jgi:hypothetical protein